MEKDDEDVDEQAAVEDAIERRLVAARDRLRQANQRLDTREHAVINPASRVEDDKPTRPFLPIPKKV